MKRLFVVCFLIVGLAGYVGCSRSGSQKETETKLGAIDTVKVFYDMLQPDRYYATTATETAVNRVNQWLRTAHPGYKPNVPKEVLQVAGISSVEKELARDRFNSRDTDFLRDCFLFRAIANDVTKRVQGRLDQVSRMFEFVVMSVAIDETINAEYGLDPFSVLLLGRGRAEHRAWIFAGLLRQLKVTSFVISREKTGDDALLVGVLIPKGKETEIRLFDLKQGVPVVAKLDAKSPRPIPTPSTITEVSGTPGADHKSAHDVLKAESGSLSVQVIGEATLFSPRAKVLQESLSGSRSAVVSAKLAPGGIVEAVARAGGLEAAKISVWTFPDEQRAAAESRSESVAQSVDKLLKPLQAPFTEQKLEKGTTREDREQTKIKGTFTEFGPSYGLQRARVLQLTGDFETSIRRYKLVRQAGRSTEALDNNLLDAQERAEEMARLWNETSRLGLIISPRERISDKNRIKELTSISRALSAYRDPAESASRRVPIMAAHSRLVQAIALARAKNFARAVAAVALYPPDDAQFPGSQFLLRYWQALRDAAKN